MQSEYYICDHCGKSTPTSQQYNVGAETICEPCATEETVICSCCGERLYRDDNAGNEDFPLCQRCFDRSYTNCDSCGRIIHTDNAYYEDEDEPLCYICHTHRCQARVIQDYSYKPEPLFHGVGSRYFGVELEIDKAGESDRNAGELLELADGANGELLYCKHDGSLEDGFELVTHPMTLAFHRAKMPWAAVLDRAKSMGYRSHQAGTCGLHVHVNRSAFGATEAEQDAAIARILYFFEKHWEELLKFSRRTQHQLEQWAARYGYKEHPKDILDHAKKGCPAGRYTCVNLQNIDTIEFRMFRGTLNLNTVIATLQLLDRICDVALFMSDKELKGMSWTTFVAGIRDNDFPELVRYLKERRLYVNEVVAGEEEI